MYQIVAVYVDWPSTERHYELTARVNDPDVGYIL